MIVKMVVLRAGQEILAAENGSKRVYKCFDTDCLCVSNGDEFVAVPMDSVREILNKTGEGGLPMSMNIDMDKHVSICVEEMDLCAEPFDTELSAHLDGFDYCAWLNFCSRKRRGIDG